MWSVYNNVQMIDSLSMNEVRLPLSTLPAS